MSIVKKHIHFVNAKADMFIPFTKFYCLVGTTLEVTYGIGSNFYLLLIKPGGIP